MSAPSIPHVKAAVRATDVPRAEATAREALSLSSAGEVRELLRLVDEGVAATMRSKP
jgi:phosphoenolpyruvate-protein kinase (PTS system EI component)